MNRIVEHILMFVAAFAVLSCAKEAEPGFGGIGLTLDVNRNVDVFVKNELSEFGAVPSSEDINLTLKNYAGNVAWKGKISQWDSSAKIPSGNYTFIGEWAAADSTEGFDCPSFFGEKEFVVETGKTTDVQLKVSMSNCMMKFTASDWVKTHFPTRTYSVTTFNSHKILLNNEEDKVFYFEPYRYVMKLSLTDLQGRRSELTTTVEDNIRPAVLYNVVIESNIGGTAILVKFDDRTETIDLDIDINE